LECRNQFGHQEPGTAELRQFCTKNYGVDFDLFEKIEVHGDGASPLYKHLTQLETKQKGPGEVSWNLEKFLLDRNGKVVARFEPRTRPDAPEVIRLIDSNLAEKQLHLGQRHFVLWRVNLSSILTLFNSRSFVSEQRSTFVFNQI
jgi:glutathione peroxidase-family protein